MISKHPASFRDNAGGIFISENQNGTGNIDGASFSDRRIYRYINFSYRDDYDALMESGLYDKLTKDGLMVSHEEKNPEDFGFSASCQVYKVISPRFVPFISYPYEWCFSQLKDAALLTLGIQLEALGRGMTLKDASAYNVQFLDGKPVFIDTLSFEKYADGSTWEAYGQFCRHFLAPLAVMAYGDARLHKLPAAYIDGLPLDMACGLLPLKSRLNTGLLMHLYLNARVNKKAEASDGGRKMESGRYCGSRSGGTARRFMPRERLVSLTEHLRGSVEKLRYGSGVRGGGSWKGYYSFTNYSDLAFKNKTEIVAEYLKKCDKNGRIVDIGANNGLFSRIAAETLPESIVVSSDMDFDAVEENYGILKSRGVKNIYPLISDITNPAPAVGWANSERESFLTRISGFDVAVALALIHHISLTNNVPFEKTASLFAGAAAYLIIEWVPKEDSQTQKILSDKEDIFPDYDISHFEKVFSRFFDIMEKRVIERTERTMYLMKRK